MSFDNDRDASDDRHGPYVQAACVDCGRDLVVDYTPDGALCDECADARDTHSSALELRMAKATLPALLKNDHVPIAHPAGYLDWLDTMRATAMLGTPALTRAWYASPAGYQQHLLQVGGDLWPTLKAIAARRVA